MCDFADASSLFGDLESKGIFKIFRPEECHHLSRFIVEFVGSELKFNTVCFHCDCS